MTTALSQTELPVHQLQLDSNTTPTQTRVETNKKSQKEKRHVSDAFEVLSFQFVLFKCVFSQNIFFCLTTLTLHVEVCFRQSHCPQSSPFHRHLP